MMPSPPDEHHLRLHPLAGLWLAEEDWPPSPVHKDGYKAQARFVNEVILKGFALQQHYRHEKDGQVLYETMSVFRYDNSLGEYELTIFDSMGNAGQVHRGQWVDDAWVLFGNNLGTPSRTTLRPGNAQLETTYDIEVGGAWQTIFISRAKPAP